MGKTIKLLNDTYLVNDVYKTNEIRVGTWINGKPVYRRCFTGTISINTSGYFIIVDSALKNIDTLLKYDYFVKDGTNFFPLANEGQRNATKYLQTSYGGVGLQVMNSNYYSNFDQKPYTIIIEYTKKTD